MSLSRFLQTSILPLIKGIDPDKLKTLVLQYGRQWFNENSDEQRLIASNLQALGINFNNDNKCKLMDGILLHYYEKMLPLTGDPQFYFNFLNEHVDGTDAVEKLKTISMQGKGILLATAHFGAVEFIAPYLAAQKILMNVLLRFTTEQLSKSARDLTEQYLQSGLFSPIRFIEIGRPGTSAALDMAAVLRRSEVLLTVFDEKTDYSVPVSLFNKQLWGGAGLHKLIAFTQRNIALYTTFMLRLENGKYRLVLREIDQSRPDAVQLLYDSLSELLRENLEQWYFVHEELPFVDSDKN